MKLAGLLRIKNESRWIAQVLESLRGVCDRLFILDDHSTDNTVEICQSFGDFVTGFNSAFDTLDEARDKTFLLHQALEYQPEWALVIDGDEVLESGAAAKFHHLFDRPAFSVYALQVLYLWNAPETMRVDGVYGRFHRPSLFRVKESASFWSSTNSPGNLHCTSVPDGLRKEEIGHSGIKLLHYGYIDSEIRRAKYDWYNSIDPGNQQEDFYRHIIQGDASGPSSAVKLRHAGPLKLAPVSISEPPRKLVCPPPPLPE